MTTNQTIDGVSRRALELAFERLEICQDQAFQSCECEECKQCGQMPDECSGTDCAKTCQCSTCDHCSNALAMTELRALLDAPAYPNRLCHIDYTAHPYICWCLKWDEEAQRRFDEHQAKAAQPQGEPVVWLDPSSGRKANTISAALKRYNDSKGGAPAAATALYTVPLYAEQPQGVQMACMPVERCYDVRAKMIIAFNEAEKAGGDLDDALDAAYKSALRYSPNPLSADPPAASA